MGVVMDARSCNAEVEVLLGGLAGMIIFPSLCSWMEQRTARDLSWEAAKNPTR